MAKSIIVIQIACLTSLLEPDIVTIAQIVWTRLSADWRGSAKQTNSFFKQCLVIININSTCNV